jgi:uncharacterized alpha-E superfamily protein
MRVTLPWDALTVVTGADGGDLESVRGVGRDQVIELLTADPLNPASVRSCVERGHSRAGTLRDVISTEMWEALNVFRRSMVHRDLTIAVRSGPYAMFAEVKESTALFWGLAARTMMQDPARSFLEAGAHLEAAAMTVRMLRAVLPQDEMEETAAARPDGGEALAMLHAVGGLQAFRRIGGGGLNAERVGQFLMFEGRYPGSVAAAVESLHESLSLADPSPRTAPHVLRLGRLVADLDFRRRTVEPGALLAPTLVRVQEELTSVEAEVADRCFAGLGDSSIKVAAKA